ncbi:MAG: peptidoglycan-binding protein [Nostoc sp.]|uniref:peptidoglycan-binding protein n=1 Tax=Nostoc sp. TaxID=1180 RepID=UPI002FF7C303
MVTRLEAFKSPRFIGKPILADVEFFDSLEKIDQFAADAGIKIYVTSSTRIQGGSVSGAIVHPASRSNHLVGHGIDMNIILGQELFNSEALDNNNLNNLPKVIHNFIKSIRQDPILRWGGDFNFEDPVHIDDGLNFREPATWDAKYPIIQSEMIALSQPNTVSGQPRLLFFTQPFIQGNDVLALQKALVQKGFNIKLDSIFGSATDVAVTAFQKSLGLTADGIVGSGTRKALGL